jgi:hypothetical protein
MREVVAKIELVLGCAAGDGVWRGLEVLILPIELPRRDVLSGPIRALTLGDAALELLAIFVFPAPMALPIREVLVKLTPVLALLGLAVVDADDRFGLTGLAMLRVRAGLIRLLDVDDRGFAGEEVDTLL